MTVDNEYIVTHSPVEGDFGEDVHAGVSKLKGDHGNVGLASSEEVTTTSFPLHCEKIETLHLL